MNRLLAVPLTDQPKFPAPIDWQFVQCPSVALASLAVTLLFEDVNRARLDTVGMVVGGIGMSSCCVLAAVAIPSFIKYVRRSKTTEALMNLRKMYDGAVAYYVSEPSQYGMRPSVVTRNTYPAPMICTLM